MSFARDGSVAAFFGLSRALSGRESGDRKPMKIRSPILFSILLWTLAPDVFANPPGPLTRIADIRRLSRDEAGKGLPVKISGVCISLPNSAKSGHFVLWDAGECIWVSTRGTNVRGLSLREPYNPSDLERGAWLEVEGVTDAAAFAPAIAPLLIRRLGVRPLPAPRHPPIERLLAGSDDCQWIEVEGVVQTVFSEDDVLLVVDGHLCRLLCKEGSLKNLVDARIRVRGIFTPDVNYRSEAALLKVMISDLRADVDIIEGPPADPFLAHHVPINRLMPFSPDAHPYHRKVVVGTVVFAVPGQYFFMQDGATGLRVDSAEAMVREGQRVEAAGFVDTSYTFASLKDALVRVLGTTPVPAPESVTVKQLLDPAMRSYWGKPSSTDFGGRVVALRGRLQRVDWQEENVPATAWVESGGKFIPAHFAKTQRLSGRRIDQFNRGGDVELTGICEYDFPMKGGYSFESNAPTMFHILLAGPDSVRIVHPAPWWTPLRLTIALVGVGVAFLIAIGWTIMLRSEVLRKTRLIEDKGRIEAANTERSRIARDLHDEMGSNLTQIGLLSELGQVDRVIASSRALAGQLDAVVWAINPDNDSLEHFAQYLSNYAQDILSLAGIGLRLAIPDTFPCSPLSSEQRHQLFLAAKEALHNVIKHSNASRVHLRIHLESQVMTVEIEDDGKGMPSPVATSPGHDGLANIKKRMSRIHGHSEFLQGADRSGTLVRLSFPLPGNA